MISDLLSQEDLDDFVFTVPFCPDLEFTPDRTLIEIVLDYEDLGDGCPLPRTYGDPECDLKWFLIEDICEKLDLSMLNVLKLVPEDQRVLIDHPLLEGSKTIVISEAGLYSLLLNSHALPGVPGTHHEKIGQGFRNWVTTEVLPSLRATGSYDMDDPMGEAEDDLDQGEGDGWEYCSSCSQCGCCSVPGENVRHPVAPVTVPASVTNDLDQEDLEDDLEDGEGCCERCWRITGADCLQIHCAIRN